MTIPKLEQPDAAWVYLDSETGMYIIDCWICEFRAGLEGNEVVADRLAAIVNRHNREHHGQG